MTRRSGIPFGAKWEDTKRRKRREALRDGKSWATVRRRFDHKCPQCGKSMAGKPGFLCSRCERKAAAYHRQWRKDMAAKGLCWRCSGELGPGHGKADPICARCDTTKKAGDLLNRLETYGAASREQLAEWMIQALEKMGPGTAAKQTPDPERGRPTRSGVSRT